MSIDMPNDLELIGALEELALEAGMKALEIYATDFSAEEKDDASLVTEADRLGEEIILKGLSSLAPNIPILAEESASDGKIPDLGERFFLVDPLDGTREFVNKTGEFTVNIALIENTCPRLGVVYAPAIGKLYSGVKNVGAWRQTITDQFERSDKTKISVRQAPATGLIAVASRSHRSPETDAYLKTINVADFAAAGSSLKFCLLAEGSADIYPRFGRTMEWDTGAGQAVLEASGGRVLVHPDETALSYGKKERGFDNPYFIAYGAPA